MGAGLAVIHADTGEIVYLYRTKFALFQVMTVRLIWMLLLMQLLPSQVMRMQLKRVQI